METDKLNEKYTSYYGKGNYLKVYPTEFVVRTFLQKKLPGLKKFIQPVQGSKILEVGFGDGRNTVFLCEQGYNVTGVEITDGICTQTAERMKALGYNNFHFTVGRNSSLPFKNCTFEYILASHVCYYLDEGQCFLDNMKEYARVLEKGGYAVFSVIHVRSDTIDDINIMNAAEKQPDGTYIITHDPLKIRNGYRFHAFEQPEDIKSLLSPIFKNFIIGTADNNFYGVTERVFWVIAQKR